MLTSARAVTWQRQRFSKLCGKIIALPFAKHDHESPKRKSCFIADVSRKVVGANNCWKCISHNHYSIQGSNSVCERPPCDSANAIKHTRERNNCGEVFFIEISFPVYLFGNMQSEKHKLTNTTHSWEQNPNNPEFSSLINLDFVWWVSGISHTLLLPARLQKKIKWRHAHSY